MSECALAGTDCLAALARDALGRSQVPALRGLLVAEEDDAIVLRGTVSSYYHKQLAQETVRFVLSRRRLVNRVDVANAPR